VRGARTRARCHPAEVLRRHRTALTLVGAVVGAGLGLIVNATVGAPGWSLRYIAEPIGQVFLRLLFMLVIPLLFSALVLGVAELELKNLGRMGVRMLGYTIVVSSIAVAIGVVSINTFRPGDGLVGMTTQAPRDGAPEVDTPRPSAIDLLVQTVPDNPVKAAAEGDMLAVIFFALVFGIALALTDTDGARALKATLQGLYDVSMKMIDGVLLLMPLGVAALLYAMTARLGFDPLVRLAGYVAVVLFGLAFHMLVVYSLSVRFFGGMSPRVFFAGVRDAMITAFTTSSSSATLPTALRVAEDNLKLPRDVSRFVLTAGSAMNQNGTALFEGVTVLFLAQVYGVELGLFEQLTVVVICIVGGIGTAGVPAGSLPVIAMILAMYGIPAEGLALILGVDRLLDMARTTLNVTGDLAAAVYVARASNPEATDAR
jgi:DAACS family dicarboxylate/amino acid:cation (Na+ or H+) symporter